MSEVILRHGSSILEQLGAGGASDLHLTSDRGAFIVKDKRTMKQPLPFEANDLLDALVEAFLPGGRGTFERAWQAGASIDFGGDYRGRLAVSKEIGGLSATIRLIPRKLPTSASLGLPTNVVGMARRPSGLLLFVGQTGSGKSTTIAAMEGDYTAANDTAMYTIEDPIEYLYPSDRSLVVQREVGLHVESFAAGVEDAKRRHPRIIIVGEIRNVETARAALLAASSGHLVVSTMHAGNAAQAVDSFTSMFTPDEQTLVRTQLAQTLLAIVAQKLIAKPGGGMALAQEIAFNDLQFADLIRGSGSRGGDTVLIQQHLLSPLAEGNGNVAMEAALARLVKHEEITLQAAAENARDTSALREKLIQLGVQIKAAA